MLCTRQELVFTYLAGQARANHAIKVYALKNWRRYCYRGQFLVPQVVLTEVVYVIKRETGVKGAVDFLEELTNSQPDLIDVTVEDLKRVKEIMQQYASAKLDFVDCCIMALSERLNITQVCTLDQRDFTILRPKHCDFLDILP